MNTSIKISEAILVATFFFLCNGCSLLNESNIDNFKNEITNKVILLDVPYIKQQYDFSCGMASLLSVFEFWGDKINIDSELYKPASKKKGYTIGELKNIATNHGYLAYSLKADIEFIENNLLRRRPIIVPFPIIPNYRIIIQGFNVYGKRDDHFIVLIGYSNEEIYYIDPQKGYKKIKKDDFIDLWGYYDNALLLIGKSGSSKWSVPIILGSSPI